MSEASTDRQAVKAELRQAIRRDHEAMKADLARLIRRENPGRRRRKPTIRTTALAVAALMGLSGTALAAGEAFGVIELGGGVTAAQVSTIPVWNGTTGTFITGTAEPGSYIYHLTGGSDLEHACPNDPHPTNNIYVTSTRPLAAIELKEILDSELSHETKRVTASEVIKEVIEEGKAPAKAKPLPAGVTGVSQWACPTPGVPGQPETP
ncbi:MAG: hypothetical protein ACYCU0_07100 [Solirubrobacteraceae bacterium]